MPRCKGAQKQATKTQSWYKQTHEGTGGLLELLLQLNSMPPLKQLISVNWYAYGGATTLKKDNAPMRLTSRVVWKKSLKFKINFSINSNFNFCLYIFVEHILYQITHYIIHIASYTFHLTHCINLSNLYFQKFLKN